MCFYSKLQFISFLGKHGETVSPVKGILNKALPPHHGGYGPGHEVGVVLGSIANQVAESQLPRLQQEIKKMKAAMFTSLPA